MFYQPDKGHGLPHDPINALAAPRPIGWISTVSLSGRLNLAPFALFNIVAYVPPHVMFAPTGMQGGRFKDTLVNVAATHEFVANLAIWELRDKIWQTSVPAPPNINEFDVAGLTPIPSRLVKPPRVKETPANIECRLVQIVRLEHSDPDSANHIVIGKVVGVHIDDAILKDGMVDYTKVTHMARMGYTDYTRVTEIHTKPFPTWPPKS
ncbi:MAG: flavin reductase family protein [Alphaproteobacteria bacterium]|nr:flavin reductase family protein [Alphaproteobacteria bacterium]